jgi:hypothetical protein
VGSKGTSGAPAPGIRGPEVGSLKEFRKNFRRNFYVGIFCTRILENLLVFLIFTAYNNVKIHVKFHVKCHTNSQCYAHAETNSQFGLGIRFLRWVPRITGAGCAAVGQPTRTTLASKTAWWWAATGTSGWSQCGPDKTIPKIWRQFRTRRNQI